LHVTALNRSGFYATYAPQFFSYTLVLAYALPGLLCGILLMQQRHKDILNRT
jgi:capsular polysaccharide transport system permease protein